MSIIMPRLRLCLLKFRRKKMIPVTETRRFNYTSRNKLEIEPSFSGDGHNRRAGGKNSRILHAGLFSSILGMLGLERPKLDDDEIKDNIKHALLAMKRDDFQEASDIMHSALALAQNRKNHSAENYVLDLLANLYYQYGYYDRALAVFVELMRRLTVEGMKKNDPAMIELSLKLADIYGRTGDDERAEVGFLFCVDSAKENVIATDVSEESISTFTVRTQKHMRDEYDLEGRFSDPYALYGMVLECYAQYLLIRGRCEEASDYMNRCLELSHMVYGPTQTHTVTVMNNFGILLLNQAQFEKAAHFFAEVTFRASKIDELAPQLADFCLNYAEALWHVGRHVEAAGEVRRALLLAEESGDEHQQQRARDFAAAVEKEKVKK